MWAGIISGILSALKGLIKPELMKLEASEIAALQADVNLVQSPVAKAILQSVLDFVNEAEQAAINALP